MRSGWRVWMLCMTDHEMSVREVLEGQLALAEALLLAVSHRDEVMAAIDRAADAEAGVTAVQELLGIDHTPARAVLDMQLRRFATKERANTEEHCAELRRELDRLG